MPVQEANPFVAFGADPVPDPVARPEATRSSSPERSRIVMAVVVLGAFITIQALVSLVGSAQLLSYGHAGVGGLATIFDVGYVLLGVGLVIRREPARVIYVVIAIISLIFAVLGTIAIVAASQAYAVNYAGLVLVYSLALFPLVFLTRPSVKAVFS
jgi:hypothetical protein